MTKTRQNRANILSFLEFLKANPMGVSAKEFAAEFKIPVRTAQRIIHHLIQKHQAHPVGKGPGTRYVSAEISTIGYQFQFIEEYKPNRTHYLTQEERNSLKKLGLREGNTRDLETYSAQIYQRLIIDLSWASSHLEGNTYSLLETERLVEKNIAARGKDGIETQMILNHKEAINHVILNWKQIDLDPYSIKSIHALLSENLLKNPKAGGSIRQIPVGIEGSRYTPLDVPQELENQFELILRKACQVKDPFEQSFLVLVMLPYLQPFEDLNKRTARVSCNIPLIKNRLVPLSFLNVNRDEYIGALKRIYEFCDFKPMKSIFLKAYQYSVLQYRYVKSVLQEPNPMAVKFRDLIKQEVANSVRTKKKPGLSKLKKLVGPEASALLAIIQNEIDSLHEGNIVRFGLRPSELKKYLERK